MVVDPQDRLLVSTFDRTLTLGILPMLQFTTVRATPAPTPYPYPYP